MKKITLLSAVFGLIFMNENLMASNNSRRNVHSDLAKTITPAEMQRIPNWSGMSTIIESEKAKTSTNQGNQPDIIEKVKKLTDDFNKVFCDYFLKTNINWKFDEKKDNCTISRILCYIIECLRRNGIETLKKFKLYDQKNLQVGEFKQDNNAKSYNEYVINLGSNNVIFVLQHKVLKSIVVCCRNGEKLSVSSPTCIDGYFVPNFSYSFDSNIPDTYPTQIFDAEMYIRHKNKK